MKRWLLLTSAVLLVGACDRPQHAAPPTAPAPRAAVVDDALTAALAAASPTDTLEIIVNYDPVRTSLNAVTSALLDLGAGVLQFKHLSMVAALVTAAQAAEVHALPGIESIYLNTADEYYLAEGVPSVRADAVHAMGITGKGIGIVILDSGINGLHPDVTFPTKTVQNVKMVGNVREVFHFKGGNKLLRNAAEIFVEDLPNTDNTSGHGTHVAGIAAGTGAASGGTYTGVAPGAHLIGISAGEGLSILVLSALAGFDWIIDHRREFNIQVVNNSWGSTGEFDPRDPIAEATKAVHDRGVTVVFSGGNSGPDQNTMNRRSVAPWVISVAAGCKLVANDPTNSETQCMRDDGSNPLEPTDNEPRAHVLADFSSRGVPGDPIYHPDITAPGVRIVSARASTGAFINAIDVNRDLRLCNISAANEPFYTCASGTSMSAPHVAGVLALMEEASGGRLTPDQALEGILATARPLPGYALWEVGAGYVDALAAVQAVRKR